MGRTPVGLFVSAVFTFVYLSAMLRVGTDRRRSLPLPPRPGFGTGPRYRAYGLALCGGGSLDWEPQGIIRRNLALNPHIFRTHENSSAEIAIDIDSFYCMIYHLLGSVI
jgi:hypothetical protein